MGYKIQNTASVDSTDRFTVIDDDGIVRLNDVVADGKININRELTLNYGYRHGGRGGSPIIEQNYITRFSFGSNNLDQADCGDLYDGVSQTAGCSAYDYGYGYCMGGSIPSNPTPGTNSNMIQRYAHLSTTTSTDVGNLTDIVENHTGTQSRTYGYRMGGYISLDVDRWPFASATTDASDVGNLTGFNIYAEHAAGHDASGYGYAYCSGGNKSSPYPSNISIIQRWPTASTSFTGADVGDMIEATRSHAGTETGEYGYCVGGAATPPTSPPDVYLTTIQRFPFAVTSFTAVDVGDLDTYTNYDKNAHRSQNYGYIAVGNNPRPTSFQDRIDRFPFASTSMTASKVDDYDNPSPTYFNNGARSDGA